MPSTKHYSVSRWTVTLAMVLVMSATTASAEMMFRYRSPSVGNLSAANQQENAVDPVEVAPSCDDPANVDTVGNAPGCQGMLIVDDSALRSAASENADPSGGYQSGGAGHGNFEISHASGTYTFADNNKNIFTGQVEDMSHLFRGTNFHGDIGYWDVSGVKDMSYMFYDTPFNQDISGWDVSNVENMGNLFYNTPFNQDIGGWDVSSVKSMSGMFYNTPFNKDISNWVVSNVTAMYSTFKNSSFNQYIGSWDVSNATNMGGTFEGSSFNQDIGSWDVSNVTWMGEMFKNSSSFNQDLSGWCVSGISSEPSYFDPGASSWNKLRPDWGNCPN